jgi:hypothetical protein
MPRHISRLKLSALLSLLAVLVVCSTLFISHVVAAHAAASNAKITLLPVAAPPTSNVKVNGTGFGANETVTFTFDGAPLSPNATTDGTGAFSTKITIPKSALPGAHTIVATGQSSGDSAQATFTARTDWPGFGFSQTSVLVGYHRQLCLLLADRSQQNHLCWLPGRQALCPRRDHWSRSLDGHDRRANHLHAHSERRKSVCRLRRWQCLCLQHHERPAALGFQNQRSGQLFSHCL